MKKIEMRQYIANEKNNKYQDILTKNSTRKLLCFLISTLRAALFLPPTLAKHIGTWRYIVIERKEAILYD